MRHHDGLPVALFNFANDWLRRVVIEAAPPQFDVRFLNDPKDASELAYQLPAADFLVTVPLPGTWVPLLQRCRLVQLQGVGFDAVDMPGLAAAGIPLASTPEGTVVGVAEHTLLLILSLSKCLVDVHNGLIAGRFDPLEWRSRCHQFSGRTLGIVGLGRIGRRVAQLASVFGARVIYHDVSRAGRQFEAEFDAGYRPFDRLLAEADIVTVHTPLNSTTEGMFGAREFAAMKPGALFINTSRGRTYDLDALAAALASGHLAGAGLDVFDPQPPPVTHPLFRLPNVICSPHMATGTVEAHVEKAQAQFANFARVLRNETPLNLVGSDHFEKPPATEATDLTATTAGIQPREAVSAPQ
jgi:phosphoglycerate dehydrogenase-like enzyme